MSVLADVFSVGVIPTQHHDPNWDFGSLNVFRRIRVIGKDPVTKLWQLANGTNGTPETDGFDGGVAVFAPSHAEDPDGNTRNVALWGSAWVGFSGRPSEATNSQGPSPADSDIDSAFLVFPSHSQADDGGWQDDTGLNPQEAVSFDGQDVAGGVPGVIVPLSGAISQQLAFVPAGNALICDWFGGPKNAKYSTRIWDVTRSGDRDVKTHAPIHSFWRIYRRPVSGSISFGSATSLTTGAAPESPGQRGGKPAAVFGGGGPQDHEEAIAWVLTPGVDGVAGRGVVSDIGAVGSPPPATPSKTTTGGGGSKTQTGPTGNAQDARKIQAQQNPIAAGIFVPPLTLATTLSGLQAQLATNAGQLTQAVSMGSAGASAVGQLNDQKNQILEAMKQFWTPGKGNDAPDGGTARAVLASVCKAAFGIIDVGDAGNDPHLIATTPDGESINSAHLNILAPWKGDGFDCPPATDGAWQPITGGGPLLAQTYFRTDMSRKHPSVNGQSPGIRSWQTAVPMDYPPPPPPPPPPVNDPVRPPPVNDPVRPPPVKDPVRPPPVNDPVKPGGGNSVTGPGGGSVAPVGGPSGSVAPGSPGGGGSVAPVGGPGGSVAPISPGGSVNGGSDPSGRVKLDPYDFGGYSPPISVGSGTFFTPVGLDRPRIDPFDFGGYSNAPTEQGPSGSSYYQRAKLELGVDHQRSFMRMPNELALPALLARPQQLTTTGVPDLRGLTDTYIGMVPGGRETYEASPVAGVLSAVANQNGGVNGFALNEPSRASRYRGGVALQGGFALHPASVDIEDVILKNPLPAILPNTYFYLATTATQLAFGDPNRSGDPTDGYVMGRGGNTTWSMDWADSNGNVGEAGLGALPSAIFLDSGQSPVDPPPTCQIWGGQVVTAWNTTYGQAPAGTVFVFDGTNAGPGGTFQTLSAGTIGAVSLLASIGTITGTITTVETLVVGGAASVKIPANTIKVGSIIRVRLQGVCTSSVARLTTITVRLGPAGAITDTQIQALANPSTGTGTGITFSYEVDVVFTAVGASSTTNSALTILNNGTTGFTNQAVTPGSGGGFGGTSATNVDNYVTVSAVVSGAGTSVRFTSGSTIELLI